MGWLVLLEGRQLRADCLSMTTRESLKARPGHFWRFAIGGVFFQGGAASVESSTIIAALVHGLTGSTLAVGAAAAISRYGWLFPQIIVAYLAQQRARRMPFYAFGAFGRASCLTAVAALLWLGQGLPGSVIVVFFFLGWTAYAFVSGVVAVPYNDIVARSVPSSHRSRMLAIRFFGGGVLALIVAWAAHELLGILPFHEAYAAILFLGAIGLTASATLFVSAHEQPAPLPSNLPSSFRAFLAAGVRVLREDRRFRQFVYVQWLAGVVSMALPFYILQVAPGKVEVPFVGILLGIVTLNGLTSGDLRRSMSRCGPSPSNVIASHLNLSATPCGSMPASL